MADPVRGEFRVSGSYHPRHQADSNFADMLTGVVVADGVPPTATEHMDHHGLGYSNRVLPVLVDRADPSVSVVLWKEVRPVDFQAQARQAARNQAQRMAGETPTTSPTTSPTTPGYPEPAVTVVNSLHDLPPWLSAAVENALDGHGDGHGDEAQNVEIHLGDVAGAVSPAVGRAAHSTLMGVTDVPAPAYALPGPTASLTDLTLQLRRADGSTYTAQTRMGFRSAQRRAELAVIGSTIPVLVDPEDEQHVSIDISAWT
ncbi:hypothetical protein [Nocardioides mangrovicus]|nr:hypothetical protein [Nocardioides mangrovicus]